jgi:hypothetical protein
MAEAAEDARLVEVELGTKPSEHGVSCATTAHAYGVSVTDVKQAPPNLLWKEEKRERRRLAKQERMNERQRRYGLLLCLVSAFDVLISGFMMCIAFAHAYLDNGVSLYCIAIQALSHMLSSALLALRFWDEYWQPEDAPAGPVHGLLAERRRVYLIRERAMSFALGFIMLISSSALIIKAARKIMYWDKWYHDHINMDSDAKFATVFLAWYGVVVYSGHAFVRGQVASVLRRKVVWEALLASVVSLLFFLAIGGASFFESEASWKAEPIAAIVLAAFTIAEGYRMIYTHCGDIEKRMEFDPWA